MKVLTPGVASGYLRFCITIASLSLPLSRRKAQRVIGLVQEKLCGALEMTERERESKHTLLGFEWNDHFMSYPISQAVSSLGDLIGAPRSNNKFFFKMSIYIYILKFIFLASVKESCCTIYHIQFFMYKKFNFFDLIKNVLRIHYQPKSELQWKFWILPDGKNFKTINCMEGSQKINFASLEWQKNYEPIVKTNICS